MRILLIDNHDGTIDLFRQVFVFPGYDLLICPLSDNEEEIKTASKNREPFAIAFIDSRFFNGKISNGKAVTGFSDIKGWLPGIDGKTEIIGLVQADDFSSDFSLDTASSLFLEQNIFVLQKPVRKLELLQMAKTLSARIRAADLREKELLQASDMERKSRLDVKALRGSRIIFHSFMQYLPLLAFIKNKMGRYVYINDKCREFFGIDPVDVKGKTDAEILPANLVRQLKDSDSQVINEGKVASIVTDLRFKDQDRYYLTFKFPIAKNGISYAIGGIIKDITKKIQADKDLCMPVEEDNSVCAQIDPGQNFPNALPGLNIEEGVRRFGGAWDLYSEIVSFFCNDKKNIICDLKTLIREKKFNAALLGAHALKGSAATISAGELSEAARQLEFICDNEDKTRINEAVEKVEIAFSRILASAEIIESDYASPLPKKENPEQKISGTEKYGKYNHCEFSNLFSKLDKSLEEFDPVESKAYIKKINDIIAINRP
ncbi:PAS domain-containing protein, partial [Desulfobacterales bacterium HSG16]|nr:PAS domain-containing protein [Desulfobacterales bacterium HSG16]